MLRMRTEPIISKRNYLSLSLNFGEVSEIMPDENFKAGFQKPNQHRRINKYER